MRLNLAPALRHLRAAVVSFPPDILAPGEPTRVAEGHVGGADDPLRPKLERLQQYFLDATDREARAGAELVAWPEMNLLVLAEGEGAFLDRARALAAERRVNLVMGMGTVHLGAPKPLENKSVFVDGTGVVRFSYRKTHPVIGWEQGIMIPGDGHLPLAEMEFGRMTSSVCFDADFAGFMRQIGHARADVWVVPANDWGEIKRIHLAMAAFRAVENGVPMLRPASRGVSAAADAWGRVLGETDHASGATTLVVEIPIGHVPTLYSRIGDLFAWLCVASLAAAMAGRLGLRPRRSNTALGTISTMQPSANRLQAAHERIDRDYARPLTVAELARVAGCSAFSSHPIFPARLRRHAGQCLKARHGAGAGAADHDSRPGNRDRPRSDTQSRHLQPGVPASHGRVARGYRLRTRKSVYVPGCFVRMYRADPVDFSQNRNFG